MFKLGSLFSQHESVLSTSSRRSHKILRSRSSLTSSLNEKHQVTKPSMSTNSVETSSSKSLYDQILDDGYVSNSSESDNEVQSYDQNNKPKMDFINCLDVQKCSLSKSDSIVSFDPSLSISVFGSRFPFIDLAIFYILITTLNGAALSFTNIKFNLLGYPPLRLEWIALCILSFYTIYKIQLNNPRMLLPNILLLIFSDIIVYQIFVKSYQGRLSWLLPIFANTTVYFRVFVFAKTISNSAAWGLVGLTITATEFLGPSKWWMEDTLNMSNILNVFVPLHAFGYGIFSIQISLYERIMKWQNDKMTTKMIMEKENHHLNLTKSKLSNQYNHQYESFSSSSHRSPAICITEISSSSISLTTNNSNNNIELPIIRVNSLPWNDVNFEKFSKDVHIRIGGLLFSTEYQIEVDGATIKICTRPKENLNISGELLMMNEIDDDEEFETTLDTMELIDSDDSDESISLNHYSKTSISGSHDYQIKSLESAIVAAEVKRNELANRLKKIRKNEQKTESSIRGEIEALRRTLERSATADHRAKQRVLALQEQVKQLSRRIEQVQMEIKLTKEGNISMNSSYEIVLGEWEIIKEESDKRHMDMNESIAKDEQEISEVETIFSNISNRYEKLQTKKEKLKMVEILSLEKKLSELKQELMAVTLQQRYAERQRRHKGDSQKGGSNSSSNSSMGGISGNNNESLQRIVDPPKLPNPYLSPANIEALDRASEEMTRRIKDLNMLISRHTSEMSNLDVTLETFRGKKKAELNN